MNIRAEYNGDKLTDYVDVTGSLISCQPFLASGVIPSNWNSGAGLAPGNSYDIVWRDWSWVTTYNYTTNAIIGQAQ